MPSQHTISLFFGTYNGSSPSTVGGDEDDEEDIMILVFKEDKEGPLEPLKQLPVSGLEFDIGSRIRVLVDCEWPKG